jgi:cell wall-associated protease
MNKTIKHLIFALCFGISIPFASFAQDAVKKDTVVKEDPKNWHQLDQGTTGYYGISLNKAYDLLKGKKSRTVVVAVIDSGIDTLHEDLKPILWHNPKEIPGNGIDDDHNGYVDDIYGWNFIGGKDGRNVKEDSYEGARVYHSLKAKYDKLKPTDKNLTPAEKAQLEMYLKAKQKIEGDNSGMDYLLYKRIYMSLAKGDSLLQLEMKKPIYTGNELDQYDPKTAETIKAKAAFLNIMKANKNLEQTNKDFMAEFDEFIRGEERKMEAKDTPPKDLRHEIVKDDETNFNDRFYGNNDVMAGTPFHGTHCSGIIAAVRNNGVGVDGIADNVRIMMVRAVPDGDEHDKDIALAIRYAVDNGAQIISMSFGKDFSPQKGWVDDAVKYAEAKGVLLVHAAGNDNKNIDTADNFPNPVFLNGSGRSNTFITVGASGDPSNGGLTANFSNYGKKEVDVFAPGVKIYSTIPGGNTYGNASGTSMACPVVAGIAALLLEYYPSLTAQQLKYVIEKSATHLTEKVNLPGTDDKVDLADISKTGGLVNAYEAVKLAATLKGERNLDKPVIKAKLKRKTKD